tara:strand:- start:6730 stop:7146 length:417 start_codon:yes stop_codon:yes gene_type:complete
VTNDLNSAFELAKQVMAKAYAPYSKFKVGAVVKAKGEDRLFSGANVENAVNGASVCAEITAISQMASQCDAKELEWVMVVSEQEDPLTPPCGLCRQWIFEFTDDLNLPIYIYSVSGKNIQTTLGELLPMAYKGKEILK